MLKLDSNGTVQWEKTYGGTDSDSARSIQQTSDGGYIVAGRTLSYGAGGWDFWIIKLNSSGTVQWEKTYGGSFTDIARSIQQTSDGVYIVAGQTNSFGAGSADFLIIKLNSSGVVQWEKTYGGSGGDATYSIQQTSDGGYVVTGTAGNSDAWVLKLDSSGAVQWEKTYYDSIDSRSNIPHSIQQTSDGGYIVAGYTSSVFGYMDSRINYWVLKLDSSGAVQWEKNLRQKQLLL